MSNIDKLRDAIGGMMKGAKPPKATGKMKLKIKKPPMKSKC